MDDTAVELEKLRSELSELRHEVASLRADSKPVEGAAPEMGGGGATDGEAFAEPANDRRGFLRLAGVAAVGATAAAIASAATAEPAAAATGGAWLIGVNSQSPDLPSERTRMFNPSSTVLAPSLVVSNNYSSGAPVNPPANHRVALVGTTSGNDTDASAFRTGVYGRTQSPNPSGGQGVFGSADGVENTFTGFRFGVAGTAGDDGYGLFGFCPTGTGSTGVIGRADAGIGVVASSSTGLSLHVRDGGRVLQDLRSTVGTPTSGTFLRGEMIRDLNADMYICVVNGTPGTWRKVTAQHPAFADAGGSINLLPRPIRLIDSRGNGAPITNGSAWFAPNIPLLAQITGTVADSLSVPSGAKGVLGNLTATDPLGNGFALVWPGGQPQPATSNINFGPANATPAIANYFVSALDTAGQMNVMCAAASTHLIVDVFGFVF